LINVTNIDVTGDLIGSASERGFLQLVFEYPSEQQAGPYDCEVNGVTDMGRSVLLTKTFHTNVTQPSFSDLVDHVRNLEIVKEKLETKNQNLEMNITELNQTMSSELNQLKSVNQNLMSDITTLSSKLDQVISTVERTTNIESGLIDCKPKMTLHNTWYAGKFTQHFTKAYNQPPNVHVSVTRWEYRNSDTGWVDFLVDVTHTNTTSFTVYCQQYQDHTPARFKVSWVSMPNIH
jgi:hypothetical protein